MAEEEKVSPYGEIGVTGLKRSGGYVQDEFLRELHGRRGMETLREMANNDATVGAFLFAVNMLCRRVSWSVAQAGDQPQDVEAADFLQSCLGDMSHSWEDFITDVLSMLPYGFAPHEIVYKQRQGANSDQSKRSKYSDGRIGWRKLPIRAQTTIDEWKFDESGGIQGLYQSAPPSYSRTYIPIEKLLLFRPESAKNNPQGRSVLRNAYRSWYLKKHIEQIEAIGIERDLAGLPVAKIPADVIAKGGAQLEYWKRMVTNLRRDEQEGIVMPLVYDKDGHELFKLELLSTGGRRQFDTNAIINRYDQRIAMTVLADLILIGQGATGSYALMDSKVNLFEKCLNAWLDIIAAVMNRIAIPRLFALNAFNVKELPRLVHGPVDAPDLKTLGEFISQLSGASILLPDTELENHLRQAAQLPVRAEQDTSVGKSADPYGRAAIAKAERAAQELLDALSEE